MSQGTVRLPSRRRAQVRRILMATDEGGRSGSGRSFGRPDGQFLGPVFASSPQTHFGHSIGTYPLMLGAPCLRTRSSQPPRRAYWYGEDDTIREDQGGGIIDHNGFQSLFGFSRSSEVIKWMGWSRTEPASGLMKVEQREGAPRSPSIHA
jgi:hypothetical protein